MLRPSRHYGPACRSGAAQRTKPQPKAVFKEGSPGMAVQLRGVRAPCDSHAYGRPPRGGVWNLGGLPFVARVSRHIQGYQFELISSTRAQYHATLDPLLKTFDYRYVRLKLILDNYAFSSKILGDFVQIRKP
jgi:hypothetical protein